MYNVCKYSIQAGSSCSYRRAPPSAAPSARCRRCHTPQHLRRHDHMVMVTAAGKFLVNLFSQTLSQQIFVVFGEKYNTQLCYSASAFSPLHWRDIMSSPVHVKVSPWFTMFGFMPLSLTPSQRCPDTIIDCTSLTCHVPIRTRKNECFGFHFKASDVRNDIIRVFLFQFLTCQFAIFRFILSFL